MYIYTVRAALKVILLRRLFFFYLTLAFVVKIANKLYYYSESLTKFLNLQTKYKNTIQ